MKRILTLSACAALSSPVLAADVALAMSPGPPLFASNPWEGFYFGGHVGYSFGTSSYQSNPPGLPAAGPVGLYGMDGQFGPLAAGLQAGYNHVTRSGLMFGFEADFSFPDKMNSNLPIAFSAAGPSEVTDNIEIFGALRGRIGYAFGDWLIYAPAALPMTGTWRRARILWAVSTESISGAPAGLLAAAWKFD